VNKISGEGDGEAIETDMFFLWKFEGRIGGVEDMNSILEREGLINRDIEGSSLSSSKPRRTIKEESERRV
jgi:hypothetical protein